MAKMRWLGPTGKFPDGKLRPDDQGELLMKVTLFEGNVVMEFGTEVSWVAMRPVMAREFGKALQAAADKAEQMAHEA